MVFIAIFVGDNKGVPAWLRLYPMNLNRVMPA